MECQGRDDWSRQCSPVLSTGVRALSVAFCAMVGMNASLALVYAFCLCQIRRPTYRAFGFCLVVLGLTLSAPLAAVRIRSPEILPSEHAGLMALFILGDIMDHVGLIMIIYWDICREAVLLIFALDPARKSRNLKLCCNVGSAFMVSQVVILGFFLPSMSLLEGTEYRAMALSTFYVVQISCIFGLAPPIAFGLLARSLHNLWAQLPQDLPRRLVHHLRYTQYGLHLLMLICTLYAFCGLLPGVVPELRKLGGFIYFYVVMLAAGFVLTLLLLGELILTMKQLRSKALRTQPLGSQQMVKLLAAGADLLSYQDASTKLLHVPVWQRGLERSVMQSFLTIAEEDSEAGADSQTTAALKTTEICERHVKPLTAPARCSAWEALAAGCDASTGDAQPCNPHQYLNIPTVMVSHCWASPFEDVLSTMQRYDENTNSVNFFFFDVFSMNQHDFADLTGSGQSSEQVRGIYDVMLEALTKSIRTPNRVLLALTPHYEPKLLTRSWCLYEIYIAWKVGAEVSCGFVPRSEQTVIRSLREGDALIEHMLSRVDAEKSQATVESDRSMILGMIRKAGVENFNQFVRAKLAASLRLVALTTVLGGTTDTSEQWVDTASVPELPLSTATRSHFIHLKGSDEIMGQTSDVQDFHDVYRV